MLNYYFIKTSFVSFLILLSLHGCKENRTLSTSEKVNRNEAEFFDLNFSGISLKVEMAALSEEREKGLMFRNSIADNEGMLFVFEEGTEQRFWMKNTRIPLDIGYISTSGVLLEVHKAKPYDLSGVPSRSKDIKFVLELKTGGFKKHGITIGSRISLVEVSGMLKKKGLNPKEYNLSR